jgi:hypothetical protein
MKCIIKFCADDLRIFINSNYNIKLKASHAHELVAAFFGYKSNAALIADTIAPISKLPQANFIVLAPTEPIEERRKQLHDLPLELPDNQVLGEIIYSTLLSKKHLLTNPWPTHKRLAFALADEYLREQKMDKIYRKSIREGVSIENADNQKHLLVSRFYQLPIANATAFMVREIEITTSIKLPFIAGRIGYGKPEISLKIEKLGTRP